MRLAAITLYATTILFIISCGSQRTQQPSAIAIMPLLGYEAMKGPSADTTYQLYRTEEIFAGDFRSTSNGTRKPDMGQMIVSVQLKNSTSMHYERAEYIGSRINVFLKTCAASMESNCRTGSSFLATIPRVGNARSVQFHINGEARSIVSF